MNTAFLLMTSACLAGADAAPAAPAPVAAPITVSGTGCGGGCGSSYSGCGSTYSSYDSCGSCGPRVKLCDRLKGLFAKKSSSCYSAPACSSGCGSTYTAPVYHAPAPVYHAPIYSAPSCGSSCYADTCHKESFFSKLKGRLCKKKSSSCCESGWSGGCGSSYGSSGCYTGSPAVAPAAPVDAPKEMPKVEPKKPTTTQLPTVPSIGVSAEYPRIPELAGSSSKY